MPLLALIALAGAALLTSIPPGALFLGWLFVAPLVQLPPNPTALGQALNWGVYIAPILLFVALTVARPDRSRRSSKVDWLPAAYVAYVFVAMYLTSDLVQTNPFGALKALVTIVGIGAILYYFLVIGPGTVVTPQGVVATLMAAAVLQGLMAMIEVATGWNLWNFRDWQEAGGAARAVATLSNPGVLGIFLGTAIVYAVTVLTWDGPRSLRRPSWVVLAVCVPGLLATLTRGPILATAVVVILLLLLGQARIVGWSVLAGFSIAFLFLLPTLRETDLYRERVAETANVRFREAVRDWSLRLAADKPLFGWGYGSFDRAKNTSGFYSQGVPIRSILAYTSHDTYLTLLVELGAIGLLLFASPFLVLGYMGVARARAPGPDRWLIVGALGSLLVILLTGNTLDFRFFSIAQALPFLFLVILRRTVAAPPAIN